MNEIFSIEQNFLDGIEKASELCYEKFSSGEISAEQLRDLYDALRRWTQELENLITLLNMCNKSTIITLK